MHSGPHNTGRIGTLTRCGRRDPLVIHYAAPTVILLIDNYDSFVFNLARYFERLGQETRVVRNDVIDAAGVRRLRPSAIALSPGPCAPQQAGCSLEVVEALHAEFPILGVCLGHQTIAEALGGRVVRAPEPVHGRTSHIDHDRRGIFAGLPSPLVACRYHSLIVEETTLPACLEVTARTADGLIMALRHHEYPVIGVQFHPESILTEHGAALLAGFLREAGLQPTHEAPATSHEIVTPAVVPLPQFATPVTF
jgi:anthranilate synthase/aminodeoxychorismate synthase-like glutamine amidotransferase